MSLKQLRKILYLIYFRLFLKKKLSKTVTEKIGKFLFTVYPSAFNPNDFISSKVFASYIETMELSGKSILDMGCGSGIVSIFAASKGARCTAVDINPSAVKSAKENAEANGFIDKITVAEGDLFEALPNDNPKEKEYNSNALPPSPFCLPVPQAGRGVGGEGAGSGFDIIFFNPPYYKGEPGNNFERAFKGGENYDVIHRFMRDAKKFLNKDGCICLIISSDMGIDVFTKIAENYGYSLQVVTKIKKLFETFYIINMV